MYVDSSYIALYSLLIYILVNRIPKSNFPQWNPQSRSSSRHHGYNISILIYPLSSQKTLLVDKSSMLPLIRIPIRPIPTLLRIPILTQTIIYRPLPMA